MTMILRPCQNCFAEHDLGAPHRFKRFILFGWDSYYPAGGLGDARGSFDTEEEARRAMVHVACDGYELLDRVEGVSIDVERTTPHDSTRAREGSG